VPTVKSFGGQYALATTEQEFATVAAAKALANGKLM
jgi:hypothetical protein